MPRRPKELAAVGLPSIWAGDDWRVLAAKPTTDSTCLMGLPAWPVGIELPPERWQECDYRSWNVPVDDQLRTMACVGFQWTTGFRYAWRLSGQRDVAFNPFWVYGWCNQGKDQGSQIGWGYRAIREHGMIPTGKLEDGDLPRERVYFPSDLQKLATVQQKANRYGLGPAYKLRKPQDIGTALSLGFLPIGGIFVDEKLGRLDAEGVCPLPTMNNPNGGGHAVVLVGLKKTKRWGWTYLFHNSWGTKWGDGGFGWIHDRHFTDSGWPFDAYAIQAVSDDPQDQASDPPSAAA